MQEINQLLQSIKTLGLPPWLYVLIIGSTITLLLLVVKRWVINRSEKLTNQSHFSFDTLFINAVKLPSTLIVLAISLSIFDYLSGYFELSSDAFEQVQAIGSKLLLILALVIFIDRLAVGSISNYANSSSLLNSSSGIIKGLTRGFVFGIGALIVLGTLGISITPIVASLGISSLAVALALQPTLENFFSGVQLIMDKPIRVGDFIELEGGDQGFVDKIGWRSTWVRMLPNNTVIMPNSQLAQSKIINYFYPEKELSVPVEVGVHYNSDLEKVERVCLEVAKKVLQEHEFGVATYEPFVLFHTFDSSSINFTVMLRTKEYFNRFFIKSAFIKLLHKRFGEEGIVIPYPIRAINLDQENAKIHLTE